METTEYLTKPYTTEEMKERADEQGFITGVILIDLEDAIGRDFEQFLDLLAIRLVDNDLLTEIEYSPIGILENGEIMVRVSGGIDEILNFLGEE
jgi:hypothetical protein